MGKPLHLSYDVKTQTLFALREPFDMKWQVPPPQNVPVRPFGSLLSGEAKLLGFSACLGAGLTPLLVFAVSAFF